MLLVERKIVNYSELTYDPELYPRLSPDEQAGIDWQTVTRYADAIRVGADFPPIKIGIIDDESYPRHGKMIINDGVHRWKAHLKLGIETGEVLVKHYTTERDFFLDAIEPNIKHGRDIPFRDKSRLLNKLRGYDLADEDISKIIFVSMDKLENLEKRILKTSNGRTRYLKASVSKALHSGQITEEEAMTINQKHIQTRTAEGMLKQLINIIEGGALILTEEVKILCEELTALLQQYL